MVKLGGGIPGGGEGPDRMAKEGYPGASQPRQGFSPLGQWENKIVKGYRRLRGGENNIEPHEIIITEVQPGRPQMIGLSGLSARIFLISEDLKEIRLRETHIVDTVNLTRINEKPAEAYLRDSLHLAIGTLDRARDSLRNIRRNSKDFELAQARRAIEALSDTTLWDALLEARGLTDDSPERIAARNLAERIKIMSPSDVPLDSLQVLLADIDLLRQVIASALRERGVLLSPSLVQECLSATSSICTEVVVGLIAMMATAEAAGTIPARIAVVCTAIGIGASAGSKQIWDKFIGTAKAHTIEAQLQKNHHDLIDAIGDLAIISHCLEEDDPPSEEQLGIVSNLHLAVRLRVNHIVQLATSIQWPKCQEYRQELSQLEAILSRISEIVPVRDRYVARVVIRELLDARSRIDLFTHIIDQLRPSWQSRP